MKTTPGIVVCTFVSVLGACGRESAQTRLLGTWHLATDDLARVEGIDADARRKMMEDVAKGHSVSIEFQAGGKALLSETKPGRDSQADSATWRLASEDGDRFVLALTPEDEPSMDVGGRFEGDLLVLDFRTPEGGGGPTLPFRKR